MNIFFLDTNPQKAAVYHCDKHVVKMILESCQMLCSNVWYENGITSSKMKKEVIQKDPSFSKQIFKNFPRIDKNGDIKPYGIGYVNHPCTVWARESKSNTKWLLDFTGYLILEYEKRYHKTHACKKVYKWLLERFNTINQNFIKESITEPAQAMPDKYKNINPITAYRDYYIGEKSNFAKWNNSEIPVWYIQRKYKLKPYLV